MNDLHIADLTMYEKHSGFLHGGAEPASAGLSGPKLAYENCTCQGGFRRCYEQDWDFKGLANRMQAYREEYCTSAFYRMWCANHELNLVDKASIRALNAASMEDEKTD